MLSRLTVFGIFNRDDAEAQKEVGLKIALITIHYANSYGGTLQALASQQILARYGEVEIIDYKSKELRTTLRLIRIGCDVRSLLRAGKDLFRLAPRARLIRNFKSFFEEKYFLSKECFSSEDLQALSKRFDFVVCGSDQIWNPKITGGLDLNYMLGFVEGNKRVSFSSSAGSYTYTKEEAVKVKRELSKFKGLSVREENTAETIQGLLDGREVFHTLDPTLMLKKNEWLALVGDCRLNVALPRNFILVYTLKKDSLTRGVVNKIKVMLGLDVVAIDQDPYLGYHADVHVMDASPADYIAIFSQATFVVTNSFHGTAFAVNFEIPFVTTQPESGSNRIEGLLGKLGLMDRFIRNLECVPKEVQSFSESRKHLEQMRANTITFLESSLSAEDASEKSGVI